MLSDDEVVPSRSDTAISLIVIEVVNVLDRQYLGTTLLKIQTVIAF